MHFDVAAQLAQILRQVVGKRIVVVEEQNHFPNSQNSIVLQQSVFSGVPGRESRATS
jgi:hypothetical protein